MKKRTRKLKQKSSVNRSLILLLIIIGLVVIGVLREQSDEEVVQAAAEGPLIVDHTSVALFDQIPDQYLTAARNLKMVFSDRSVGQNINESLDCLVAATWASSATSCRRDYYGISGSTWNWKTYSQADYDAGLVPQRILFTPDPVKYSRGNWTFVWKQGLWYELTKDYIETLIPQYIAANDIVTYQFSYLNVSGTGLDASIDDPNCGFLATSDRSSCAAYLADWHVGRIGELETQYPDKTFIYWTSSLARSIGSADSDNFNQGMRNWAVANNKVLFDMADIISYTDTGVPCYDNRDGVEFCQQAGGACENYPDDAVAYRGICQDYTTELDGGHLSSVSGGKIAVAKAYWVLMAQIAGWQPGGPTPTPGATEVPTVSPSPSPTPSPSPFPSPSPSPSPSPTPIPDPTTPVYWLNFDDEGTFGDCTGCTRYNTTLVAGGIQINAFDFNGTNSYVDLGNISHIKGKSQFTLTTWVKPDFDETSVARRYVFSDGGAMSLYYLETAHDWRLVLKTASGTAKFDTQGLAWDAGTWHMLAVTYDGASARIYWDGQMKASLPATGLVSSDTITARVGTAGVLSSYFDGLVDELKIYDNALTDLQIQGHYASGN